MHPRLVRGDDSQLYDAEGGEKKRVECMFVNRRECERIVELFLKAIRQPFDATLFANDTGDWTFLHTGVICDERKAFVILIHAEHEGNDGAKRDVTIARRVAEDIKPGAQCFGIEWVHVVSEGEVKKLANKLRVRMAVYCHD